MYAPVVSHKRIIDPKAHTVIGSSEQHVLSPLLSLHETGPTHTVVIVRQLRRRSSGPLEIYLRIDAFLPEFIKVFAAEIAGTQAAGLTVIVEQLPRRNRLGLVSPSSSPTSTIVTAGLSQSRP